MMKQHYPLSPSASKRWITCPASIKAPPSPESAYAEEGTEAHGVGEAAIRTGKLECEDHEMAAAVAQYVSYVEELRQAKRPFMEMIEETLEHSQVADLGGTEDYVALYSEDGKTICHTVDYKHGAGIPVHAEENFQMLTYSSIYDSIFGAEIDLYRMTIIQPRCLEVSPVQEWECEPKRVREHTKLIIEATKQSHYKAGEHCRFCSLAPTCDALRQEMLLVAQQQFESAETQDLLTLYEMSDSIRAALDELQAVLIERARTGYELPGYKIVESIGNREWAAPEDRIYRRLRKLGISRADARTTKLKSPAALEKLLDKEHRKGAFEGLITRQKRGLRLVPETARGTPILLSANDVFEDYYDGNEETGS